MSFARVYSAQTHLLKAYIVTIEIDLSRGLHSFAIVGLPDKAIEEAKDRIAAAIKNSGFESPKQKNQKTVIALAPADIKKEGPIFDVAMALGYLLASEDITFETEKKIFFGELALDGTVRKINGILPLVEEAKRRGFNDIFVPKENAREAALVSGVNIYATNSLGEIIEHLTTKESTGNTLRPEEKTVLVHEKPTHSVDLADIKGQESAKRALEIAASGAHNIAFFGPPGTGKTMLAKALCSLLPELPFERALESTAIHSVAGILKTEYISYPPFRSPHHTSSYVSLIGGGSTPKPGEVTLAHNGVLFLDEFPEFETRVIESLRQPLEDRVVHVARAKGSAEFPARFMLVAAMNPCPCGNFGIASKRCTCTPVQLQRYRRKISGPIVDRIDLWCEVSNVTINTLQNEKRGESMVVVGDRVRKTRQVQEERFKNSGEEIFFNSEMGPKSLLALAFISKEAKEILTQSAVRLDLSPRSYHKVIKVARTIADIANSKTIEPPHILEALQYRPKKFLSP